MTITLGSLFDGIGVFPLAASRHGITPIWASEIVPDAISITKRHFPAMVHLGDITKLDGGKIPAVHVITFGSPCQNLSSVGPRDGLSGAKSSLFYQAIRIIEEMRNASGGLYPAIIVWENVIGAMQQNLKNDYLAVLKSFAGAEVSMPDSGHWADAGVVRGRRCDLAWRVMDAELCEASHNSAANTRHARLNVSSTRIAPTGFQRPKRGRGTDNPGRCSLTISSRTIRKSSPCGEPELKQPGTFSQQKYLGRTSLPVRPRSMSASLISFVSRICSIKSPDLAPCKPARVQLAIERS